MVQESRRLTIFGRTAAGDSDTSAGRHTGETTPRNWRAIGGRSLVITRVDSLCAHLLLKRLPTNASGLKQNLHKHDCHWRTTHRNAPSTLAFRLAADRRRSMKKFSCVFFCVFSYDFHMILLSDIHQNHLLHFKLFTLKITYSLKAACKVQEHRSLHRRTLHAGVLAGAKGSRVDLFEWT